MNAPWRWSLGIAFLLALGLGLLCFLRWPPLPSPETLPASSWFVDATDDVGLSFVHDPGPSPQGLHFMPQIMGSGGALLDFDNDGRLDLYLVHNAGPDSPSTNRLFRQGSDGRFTDVSAGSGLDVAGFGMGVAVGDLNNDGRADVLLTAYGGTRLFLNTGRGKFVECGREAGIDNPLWGTSAAFVDYDRDGWLDVVVTNYVDYDPTRACSNRAGQGDYCHPSSFPGTVTRLYRNRGLSAAAGSDLPCPRLEDVTVSSGLARAPGPGLGVICADFDGDGWPDIFVANDSHPNHLWINQKDGTFREEAVWRGCACNALGQTQADMGVALGDVDGDGLFDLFVTHLTEQMHTLYRQHPRGAFQDRTGLVGLATPHWRGTGFGTVLGDFDHDGALDLAVVNGRVARGPHRSRTAGVFSWDLYAERNQLFANDGRGRFRDISPENAAFSGPSRVSRGLLSGDLDNDGALDLVVTCIGEPARLYRNVIARQFPDRRWLLVRAVDPGRGGRDAHGAEIVVRAGSRRWVGLVNPGSSYLCSNDPRVHFGLGTVRRVDSLEVKWPDGSQERFPGPLTNQVVVIRKGQGQAMR